MATQGANPLLVDREPANPNELRRGSLRELADRLEWLRKTTRDVVADVRELRMEEDASIAVPSVGTYPATHHAHTQIAEKAGIPGRFYDRLRQDFPALLAANVNGLLPAGADRRLIRVADGKVRALLSDRYRSLDSYDLALRVADRAIANNAQVLDASLTETRMSIRVTLPQYREKVGEMTAAIRAAYSGRAHGADMAGAGELDADYVVPGLVVSNSDVGAGAFRVEPYVYRLVCMNGAIGEYSLKQIHVGERLELGEIVYSDRTRAIQDEALWARVGDVIDSTFNPDTFRAMLDQMRAAKSEQLPGVEAVVDVVARDLGLSADRRAMLLSYFAIEGPTVYGLVQGVTAIAQHEAGADAQAQIERYAGGLLSAPAHILEVGATA